jgi:hypothetical protein
MLVMLKLGAKNNIPPQQSRFDRGEAKDRMFEEDLVLRVIWEVITQCGFGTPVGKKGVNPSLPLEGRLKGRAFG